MAKYVAFVLSERCVCLPGDMFGRNGVKWLSRSDWQKKKDLATHIYDTAQHTDAH